MIDSSSLDISYNVTLAKPEDNYIGNWMISTDSRINIIDKKSLHEIRKVGAMSFHIIIYVKFMKWEPQQNSRFIHFGYNKAMVKLVNLSDETKNRISS